MECRVKRVLWWLALLLGGAITQASEKLAVVVSFSVLADITQQVGGPLVQVHALVGPDADAHVHQPRPSDLMAVTKADLVIRHGLGFDPWMNRMLDATAFKGPVVVVSARVQPLRSDDAIDPHAWQDPRNVVRYAEDIAAAIIALRPVQADAIRVRKDAYVLELQQLHDEYAVLFARLPPEQRGLVTSHDAFGYLARAYGLRVLAPQGWSTQSQASAQSVAVIVTQLRNHRVSAVFLENVADRRLLEQIAAQGGVRIGGRLYSDALAAPGHPASTYLGMMRHNLSQLARVLGAEQPGVSP
jgi:zinc/manganese transport system substrate-binding protein